MGGTHTHTLWGWGWGGRQGRFVPPCIPLYCLVFPCIRLYLFCIALYFLVFVLYASYCLVLPRIALGTLRPVSWQVVPLVRFVFLGLLP